MFTNLEAKYARITKAFTCKQTAGVIASNFETGEAFFIVAAEDQVEGLKEEFEDQDLLSEATLDKSNSLLSVLTLSANRDRMASSMKAMGESVAALSQQPQPRQDKQDSHAGNVGHPTQQVKKSKSCDTSSVSDMCLLC